MTDNKKYYAHSLPGKPIEEWQPLENHLENVADLAAEFAEVFNAKSWGKLAGKNHDIGKGTLQWQAYLRKVNNIIDDFIKHFGGHVEHSIHGAEWLINNSNEAGKLLSYCIAGHHGGLPNWIEDASTGLMARLKKNKPRVDMPLEKPEFEKKLPIQLDDPVRFGYQVQFFIRMIFSCLVDADFLDTEASLNPEKRVWRSSYPALATLKDRFWIALNEIRKKSGISIVNNQRETVLKNCLKAAEKQPRLFSLTVPTGGGKTLSSMAFAMEHAARFNKSRIIYVIPFTSIIEQNAEVFRNVIGIDAVLEHHCNFVPDDADWKTRLASENWDAPVIVTTNVQFFDSFYAHKPSKCRKLHNVANSVVIFDEVQAIPVEKLKPCMEVLKELTFNYGVTAVLCTATQPAIEYSAEFKDGLKDVSEIIEDIPSVFSTLKRTDEKCLGVIEKQDLARQIAENDQVLCIVNTRQHALDLYNMLPDGDGDYHLSALMYPLHRTRRLTDIRERLNQNLKCRVISTQLIEAGVDIDFPVVFRMAAGMDAIAQAAGRCNREGRHSTGKVFIFKIPDGAPPGYFRQTMQCAEPLFDRFRSNLLSHECIHEYFLNYYWLNNNRMDADEVIERCKAGSRGNIQFRDIADFKMIKTATIPIIIALEDKAISLIRQLDFMEYSGSVLRKLQQYTVQVYPFQFEELRDWLESPKPGINVLRSPELYSEKTGLLCNPPKGEAFII
ncbi:MAG: CRISPR-associated helicase Cas3' [Deltaproteobacteria bacterium]|nr:CRISPR-associated helicase Cas3' [Deltaproteobacteria bacterium]